MTVHALSKACSSVFVVVATSLATNMTASPWRHGLSILLLPAMVVVALPSWMMTSWAGAELRWSNAHLARGGQFAGIVLFGLGLTLFAWCVSLFHRVGRGTLAPWDPTEALVSEGPYRIVRNPMISGVAAMLLGEALFFGSAVLAGWFLMFVAVNHMYFILSEEPGLQRRFGAEYVKYKRCVPRWIPRMPRR